MQKKKKLVLPIMNCSLLRTSRVLFSPRLQLAWAQEPTHGTTAYTAWDIPGRSAPC